MTTDTIIVAIVTRIICIDCGEDVDTVKEPSVYNNEITLTVNSRHECVEDD